MRGDRRSSRAMFEQLGGLMAERGHRSSRSRAAGCVATLLGEPEPGIADPDVPSILLAADLAPADTAGLDPARILALAMSLGGPTSHTAIIARQLGIPCVVAAPVDDIAVGTTVLVDGARGEVAHQPGPRRRGGPDGGGPGSPRGRRACTGDRARPRTDTPCRSCRTCRTAHRPRRRRPVRARVSACSAASWPSWAATPSRPSTSRPTIYAEVFRAYGGRKVVIRTLDAGSDKPMKFATLPDEPNPALGVRGLRLSCDNPGLMIRQLDAIKQAADATGTTPWVMAPMVATAAEARDFAARSAIAAHRRGDDRGTGGGAARGRGSSSTSTSCRSAPTTSRSTRWRSTGWPASWPALTDHWQPAGLHLMSLTAAAGNDAGKPVGVCGEAAADPLTGLCTGRTRDLVAVDGRLSGRAGRRLACLGHAGRLPSRRGGRARRRTPPRPRAATAALWAR